jgi:hypothetical protein
VHATCHAIHPLLAERGLLIVLYSNGCLFVKTNMLDPQWSGSIGLAPAGAHLDNLSTALLESAALKPKKTPVWMGGEASLGFTEPERVERRVWRNSLAIVALATGVAAAASDSRFVLGLVLGGTLALLNYKWLHSSLRQIVAAGNEKAPPGTMIKFVVRWMVIAAVAVGANRTGYFDAVAILAGLFAPAAAVMIEAAYVACRTMRIGEHKS